MELFKKIKNKLGMLALFGMLFQLTMPVYQTYVFANENGMGTEVFELDSDDTEEESNSDEVDNKQTNQVLSVSESGIPEQTDEEELDEVEQEKGVELEENDETNETEELEEITELINANLQSKRDPELITEDIFKEMRLKYQDGTDFVEGDLINIDDDLRFELDWSLSNDKDYVAGDFFEFKLPKQLTVYSPLNGTLGNYGTYTVDLDGNVKFTFNQKVEQESDIKGTFWFDTELKESEITTTEETIELVVNEEVVQKVVVNIKPTGGQAISKNGQPVNGNFNTEEVEWTVVINTTRDSLKNAIINDPILKGQELILDSLILKEVEVDAAGKVTKELEEVTEYSNDSSIENINIKLGNTNKAYKLIFKTKLLEDAFEEGTTKYENTAYLTSDGKDDAQAGGSVSVSRPKSLEKTSTAFDKDNRSVEWKVNANFTEQSLKKGDIITDEFTFTVGKEELNGVFEIKKENIEILQVDEFDGKEVSKTSDAKNLFDITVDGNKVTYKLKEATNKAFVLKYKTELKDGAYINKDGKITNKIDLNGNESSSSQGVYQQVGKKNNAGINYTDKTINWTITVNADTQDLRNFILTDKFANSGQKLVEGSIKGAPSSATVTPDADLQGFQIDFGNIKEKYTITYQTKFIYDFEGNKTPNFKNGVNISYETSDGSDYELEFENTVSPNKQTKSNGAKNGTADQKTKEITWKIDVNYNQLKLTDAKLMDTIPDNQSLIDGTVKIYETTIKNKGGITEGADVTDHFTVEPSENQINIVFNGVINSSYRIEFMTKDKDGIYNEDEVYTNKAEFIPREGELHNLTANVTLPNQGQFIGKKGWHNKKDWTIDWTIDVNKSLSTTSDFTVTDDLGDKAAQILLEETIKVTKVGSTDELVEGEDYTLTVGDNKLEIYFPGEITEAYVVTYSSYIVAEETVDVTNEVEIQSNDAIKGITEKTEKVNIKISTGGGTGEGTTGGLTINKSEVNSNRPLADIAFTLIKKIGDQEIVVRTATTNNQGKIEWKGLMFGEYILREDVPEGYIGEAEQTVNVSSKATDGITTKEIKNERKTGIAKIIKVDATTGAILDGAEFTLENQTTKQSYTFKTASGGVISEVLPFGEYTVKEIKAPKGYRINKKIDNINVEIDKTTTITVENVAFLDINGQKTWYTEENIKLPESITVELYADGKKVTDQTVTAKSNWKYSFKDLDKYNRADREINYQIKEQVVDGYVVEKEGYDLTNIQTINIHGTKTWKDDNNPSRPKSISIDLLANNEKVADVELNAKDAWEYSFNDMPKYDIDGVKINYTIEEVKVDGYRSSINDFNITNTRANVLSIEGEKTWKDVDPTDRPVSIQVKLTRELKGKADVNFSKTLTVTPNSTGDWVYTFDKLDQFDDKGVEYTYIVTENDVPVGYEATVDQHNITNVRVGKTDVFGTKRWKDDKTSDRPKMIEVNLLRNKVVIQTKEVTAATNWNYRFANLDKYDENGQYYEYSVKENNVPGYAPKVTGTDITNTRSEKTSIEITKGWLDDHSENRPSSIIVYVYQNNNLFDTVELTALEEWTYELKDIEAYDDDGQPYTYTIKEKALDSVEEYETTISGFNITNLRVGKIDIGGEKIWKEVDSQYRPDSITVNLLANGKEKDSVEVSSKTDWKYNFTDLTQYDDQGKEIIYTIEEVEIPIGYESVVDGLNVVNTQITTEVAGEKIWLDDDSLERPDTIKIHLLANGKRTDKSLDVSTATNWEYRFTEIPKYDKKGNEIVYTVVEEEITGYETTYDGNNITNLRVGKVDIGGEKIWKEVYSQYRPDSITVNLLANGKEKDSVEVSSKTDWKYNFTDLTQYDGQGKEIIYTIEEVEIPIGYESVVDGLNVVNTQITTEVAGEKIWKDDLEEHPTITIYLLANGERTDKSLDVSTATNWEYRFTEIPKYDKAGEEIEYSVEEKALKGYETSIENYIVTNLRVGITEVSGEKKWKDAGTADRPESIRVILTRSVKSELDNDFEKQVTVTPNATGKWTYTFAELPEFDEEGLAYTYTVKEETEPAGYKSSVEGYDITNLRVGKVTLSGTKTWKDDNLDDRPDSITVNLLRNNIVVETREVNVQNQWEYTFTDLPEFDEKGIAYDYKISEEDVPGYAAEFSGMNITNTRSEKKSIEITKGWLDDDSKDRPKSIKVDVYQNEEFFRTVRLKASENWIYELRDLEVYNEEGQAYTYTIKEQAIKGYESKVTGFNITNVRIGVVSVTGEKSWKDAGPADRPDSIKVILSRELKGSIDKTFTKAQRVKPNDAGKWTYTFAELPEYDESGVAYDYRISEEEPKGYNSSVDGYNLTNTYITPETPAKPGKPDKPTKPEEKQTGTEQPDLPKTGESNNSVLYIVGGLLVFGGLILGKKRIEE